MSERETIHSVEAFLASERQKSFAIKRHYETATDPWAPSDANLEAVRALGILSRDTGQKIIIRLLDRLQKEFKASLKN